MNWVFPEYGYWALAIPVSVGIIYLVYRRVEGLTRQWFAKGTYRMSAPLLKFVLRTVGFMLLFPALAGPYWETQPREVDRLGREIYLLLDVSASMNATDIAPSRLKKAKRELKRLLLQLQGDRVGLIVFTDYAYVQCPLTRDHRLLEEYLDMVDSDQFAQSGTQYRNALGTAYERLMAGEDRQGMSSKAIVLISDGGDFGDTYTSISERLKLQGIKVFPVGIGTYDGAFVPRQASQSGQGYIKQADGSPVVSYLMDESLKQLARDFGTRYVSIEENYQDLHELEAQLLRLDASPFATQKEQVDLNRYQFLLGLALLLLMVSMFIMPIRKT